MKSTKNKNMPKNHSQMWESTQAQLKKRNQVKKRSLGLQSHTHYKPFGNQSARLNALRFVQHWLCYTSLLIGQQCEKSAS